MLPRVSVIWLNYNSMHVINVIRKSLDALFGLDYPDYELIIVDNGSVDGSREFLRKYLKKISKSSPDFKAIMLKKNLGFTGGVNIAYRMRNPKSKYVALVNNDAIPRPYYLRKLIKFLEEHKNVGAIQGIVSRLNETSIIDSAGMFIDEVLNVYPFFVGKPINALTSPIYVSYVEGTMPVYRIDAIKHALKDNDNMYVTEGFVYFLEDIFLSLMLWNQGYQCMVLPIISGRHYRMATIKKFYKLINLPYYSLRNRMALLYMTNSRYKKGAILKYLNRLIITKGGFARRETILKALISGIKFGKILKEKYGVIDLYKAPLIKMPLKKRLLI